MGKESHEQKEPQESRCGAEDGRLRPLALRLDPQVFAHRMKGDFHLPAQDKPGQDLERRRLQIGTEQGLGREFASWIAERLCQN